MVATMVAAVVPAGGARLAREIELLERLADAEAAGEPGLGVAALAELTDRDKSQVSRALARLLEVGLVERDPETLRYSIGWTIFSIAARAASGRLLSAAIGPMRALSTELGETVHLCVLDGHDLVTLRTEAPGHGYRASGWVGSRVPAHATSAGRALLVNATPAEIERRFAGVSFEPRRRGAVVRDLPSLVAAVDETRRLGYAIVDEEFEDGVAGVSAPIRDFRDAVVGALNVSAPAERIRPRLAEAGVATRAAADTIGRHLGWTGTTPAPLVARPS
jgi:DNA-binding IclR family transcriptional regulator